MRSDEKRGMTKGDSATAESQESRCAPPQIETGEATITLLSVSPIEQDHDALDRALRHPKWRIHKALSLPSAVAALLRKTRIPLVVCERDLLPGTWKEMLRHVTLLPQPPHLIVTSRFADDRLWAEALNLGAYDVLAKPFDHAELNRILASAWLHWRDRYPAAVDSPASLGATAGRMPDVRCA
jgi:DNA-binding response OmpR family regulator